MKKVRLNLLLAYYSETAIEIMAQFDGIKSDFEVGAISYRKAYKMIYRLLFQAGWRATLCEKA